MCRLGFIGTVPATVDVPARTAAHGDLVPVSELALLRRVRDRIDREWEGPLDVETLARDVGIPPGQLSRRFEIAYGRSPYGYLVSRRIERVGCRRNEHLTGA